MGCRNIGIHHAGLHVKDPAASAEFYRDLLGKKTVGGVPVLHTVHMVPVFWGDWTTTEVTNQHNYLVNLADTATWRGATPTAAIREPDPI